MANCSKLIQTLLVTLLVTPDIVQGKEFLVKLKTGSSGAKDIIAKLEATESITGLGLRSSIRKSFSFGSFEAFIADLSPQVVDQLKKSKLVASIVPNELIDAFQDEEFNDSYWNQHEAPRHLARLSRRGILPQNVTELNYYYDATFQGEGVYTYILDTGIFKDHPDFEGRATFGADFVGEGPGDLNGHGTHVAGIVGSKTYGVAKKSQLIEVKALNGQGQGNLTSVISAIEFAVNHCKESGKKCVANLSLGSFRNAVLNQAVDEAYNNGLVIIAAAGNSNINACFTSPASSDSVITVGAVDDRTDTIATFSNWGDCIDIFASGVYVSSLSNTDSSIQPVIFSGTSMASPSVCGLAAILLEQGTEPHELKDQLLHMSTEGVMKRRTLLFKPWTPNKLAFNGVGKDDDYFDAELFPTLDEEQLLQELNSVAPGKGESAASIRPVGSGKLQRRVLDPRRPTFEELNKQLNSHRQT